MLVFIVPHYPWWIFPLLLLLPLPSVDRDFLSPPPTLVPLSRSGFDLVSTFIQINFDSSFRFLSIDKKFLAPSTPAPLHSPGPLFDFGKRFSQLANDFYVFFNFLFADNFYVQQKQPYFDSHQNTNITVLEKESVLLNCAVRNKGNKTVSLGSSIQWIENFFILWDEDEV